MSQRRMVFLAGPALIALGLLLWWLTRPGPPAPSDKISYHPVQFAALEGWRDDDHGAALEAFLRSCGRFAKWPESRRLGGKDGVAGKAGDWAGVCRDARALDPGEDGLARRFFERNFSPVAIHLGGGTAGLFTGYYEPLLRGSRTRAGPYTTPLYGPPDDLVRVDLGEFSDSLKGRRIVGRLRERRLRPYFQGGQIRAGALAGRGLEIVYVDDPVDAFFLQIQGSGRVRLAEGGELRLGYAGGNGHRYFAIGRELIRRGVLTRENVSMQNIRAWLNEHPEQAGELLDLNPSYVFFRELRGPGPIGALGVALSPGRSIAVDRELIPLGIPIWLQASHPSPESGRGALPLRRLMLAQDTGGAIKGGIRGDVFWGHGGRAAAIAGKMKNTGEWFLLLPRALAQRLSR